jgi:hypothetical protein
LLVWSLFAPIDAWTLIAPTALAFGGCFVTLRRRSIHLRFLSSLTGWTKALIAGIGAIVLWLANLALGPPTAWDSGLYHFQAIGYAHRFAAVPGLANLHERLGAADGHLLFVTLLDNGPWRDDGFHLANGLLVVMLLVDIAWRVLDRRTSAFTRNVGLLLVPAVIATVAIHPGGRLSSPSLDLPVFVLVAAGTICLCEFVQRLQVSDALGATAAFAAASATRPYFLPATVVVVATIALTSGHFRRMLALAGVVPVAILIACGARQAVLTGYPLYPVKVGALPVDWRVPPRVVDEESEWVRSWAREPQGGHWVVPGKVFVGDPHVISARHGCTACLRLSDWGWFPSWVKRRATDADLLGPALLAVLAVVSLLATRRAGFRRRPAIAALVPLVLTLVLMFFAAPDPRFVYAPLWLVPIVLLAHRPLDQRIAALCTYVVAVALISGGAWRPITTPGKGPLGSFDPPSPAVVTARLVSGVAFKRPAVDDRCWRVMICAPTVRADLQLRGTSLANGFRMTTSPLRTSP